MRLLKSYSPLPTCNVSIGILGGSFNPAHEGHLAISREACKRLRLKEIWWLVSPQNPLKTQEGMADFALRLEQAGKLAAPERRIRVSGLEQGLGTRYTVDTLRALRRRYPRIEFVWLMGADNLAQFHHWKQWVNIIRENRVAVVDRAPFAHTALRSQAALRFAKFQVKPGLLTAAPPPAWSYIRMRRDPHSGTALRANTLPFRAKMHYISNENATLA